MVLVNRETIFRQLEEAYTGSSSLQHSTIREYWNLPPDKGLVKARAYMETARKGLDNARSEFSAWSWSGDVTLASCLIALYYNIQKGRENFPPVPKVEGELLMNKEADLLVWAKNLVSDHIHRYDTTCTHEYQSAGNQPKCTRGRTEFGLSIHAICSICGDDEFSNPFENFEDK